MTETEVGAPRCPQDRSSTPLPASPMMAVGSALSLSRETVRSHTKAVRSKADLGRQFEFVAVAKQLGATRLLRAEQR